MTETENKRHQLHPTTMALWFDHARRDIVDEMWYAVREHGECTTNPMRGVVTLMEEIGEVAEAALDATRPSLDSMVTRHLHLRNMIRELNQVIAYAILLRISMEGVITKEQKGE